MNYLVIEGYQEAAQEFSAEAQMPPPSDLGPIADRMRVRRAVQDGRITEAIELVNELNPDVRHRAASPSCPLAGADRSIPRACARGHRRRSQILDTNALLNFHLQQQRLIEMIREGILEVALAFAQEVLAPRGEETPQLLEELERTMTLMAFEDVRKSPMAALLDFAHRQHLASEVNAAILEAQSQEHEAKLPVLLRTLQWAQMLMDDRTRYPRISNFVTAAFDAGTDASPAPGSGPASGPAASGGGASGAAASES